MPEILQPIANGRTAEIYAWEPGSILKLFRPDFPKDWANYEAEVGRAVCAAGILAPAVLDVIDVQDRRGIVYQRIQGISMLQTLIRQPWRSGSLAHMLADLQAAMHSQSAPSLPTYRSRLERDIQNARSLPARVKPLVLEELAGLPDLDRVCHGDFHPDNVILTADGPFIIDWMTACKGNPFADVARTHLLLTIGAPADGMPMKWLIELMRRSFFRAYCARYATLHPDPQGQVAAWIPIIAAARLNENILQEQSALLAIVLNHFGYPPLGE